MPTWTADAAMRLDVFLTKSQPTTSRVKAGALVRAGQVTVNGRIVHKPAHRVKPGDRIAISDDGQPASDSHISPVDLKILVLFEDDACLVINKPSGVSVHPAGSMAPGTVTLLHGIAFEFQKRRIPFDASHILVHRLDRETTGCLLIAKTPAAHTALQKQFKDRTVAKTYLALVAGVPGLEKATIDAPIGRNLVNRTQMSVLRNSTSREARTTYRTVSRGKECALLKCDLHTGRTHQIRVHLSAIGHPILGDPTYHSPESMKLTGAYAVDGLCLHAWKLTFVSPMGGTSQTVVAPLSQAFRQVLRRVSLPLPRAR